MFKVGQKVLVVSWTAPFETTVETVGRKWATFTGGGFKNQRFDLFNGQMPGGGKVWTSREAYEEKCADEQAWRAFQRGVSRKVHSSPPVTRARLAEIASELEFDLDPGCVSKVSRIR